jgi:hypothetical protein
MQPSSIPANYDVLITEHHNQPVKPRGRGRFAEGVLDKFLL